MATQERPRVPPKRLETDYPLIDSDPHISRVLKYARPSDYAWGLGAFAAGPALYAAFQRTNPLPKTLQQPPAGSMIRLGLAIATGGGFLVFYQKSILRFYGWEENAREVEMDMREMVDKVKKGEKLYGESSLSPYLQGMAARNSRYAATMIHLIPWFNFVNHDSHGVDTAKYYQQAERELEAERTKGSG